MNPGHASSPAEAPAPSVRLEFQPVGPLAWLRHHLGGRRVMAGIVGEFANLSENPSPELRDRVHKTVSTRLLRHWQVRLEMGGLEHIRAGPYLIAALHEGMADVLCLSQLPLQMRFVARTEIFAWPWVGPIITRLGHVAIDPEQGALSFRPLLRAAREILGGGESLAIFPQGAVPGIEADFQRGTFELAKRLNVPILPVVISGTHRVWEHPHSARLRYGQRVGLRVLAEVSPDQLRNEPLEHLRINLQRRMKAVALGGELPSPRRYDPKRDGYWDGYNFDMDPDFPEVYADFKAHRDAYRALQKNPSQSGS